MINKLLKKLLKDKKHTLQNRIENKELDSYKELEGQIIGDNLLKNLDFIKKLLGNSNDMVIHKFISTYKNTYSAIIYIDGLVEKTEINEQILGSLMKDFHEHASFTDRANQIEDIFQYQLISLAGISKTNNLQKLILAILSGDTVLLIEGVNNGLIISTRAWEARGIQEPSAETTVRGPRDGFTETLRTNTSLIRRKIKDPFLRFDLMHLGLRSQTEVVIAYIEGVTNPTIVEEVKKRLKQIEIDRVVSSAEIEHLIEDNSFTLFPQISSTERPDVVSTALLDGQVAILVDNSPYVLFLPVTVNRFLISSDDYYERWLFTSFIRLIRAFAIFIVLAVPGLYICLTAVNTELMPTNLLISTSAAREGVPFPIIVELLAMEFMIELLQEAGVRLPKQIGQTVSIVGALVLGQAAISAGIVSPLTVIIVAITAIASFIIPSYQFGIAIRLYRFPIVIFSAIFGLYGWLISLIFLVIHLINITSFNVPYLSPFAPLSIGDLSDSLVIKPLKSRKMRTQFVNPLQSVRTKQHYPMKRQMTNIRKEDSKNNE